MRRSSSDRVKVVVSLCAIASSSLTLAAYFGGLDYAVHHLLHVTASHHVTDLPAFSDTAIFPPELRELTPSPPASS